MSILRFLVLICGFGIFSQIYAHRVRRFIGGQDAKPGQFPYMVSLRYSDDGQHYCGGSIIRQRFILTAAHCLEGQTRRGFYIVAGVNDLRKNVTRHYAEKWSIHSHYNTITNVNDIAIIKLEKNLNLSKTIKKIPILKSEPPAGVNMTVCGWGSLYYGGFPSFNLKFSNVTSISVRECRKKMNKINRNFPVTKRHICTYDGFLIGCCNGDSGSPLVYNGKQVGIASWTIGCAEAYPDVYVKMSSYANWIEFTIEKLKTK